MPRMGGFAFSPCLFLLLALLPTRLAGPPEDLDPGGWGSDHVGSSIPNYVTGDECLFCHRDDVGPGWSRNRHLLTLLRTDAQSPRLSPLRESAGLARVALEVQVVLGQRRKVRFLRQVGFGQLSLLSTSWIPGKGTSPGKLLDSENPTWNEKTFDESCAGCHTTGADSTTRRFMDLSLDCYVCHGSVSLEHSNDTRKVIFAKKRKDPARVIISICGQCHIRTGKSRASGLPYANNFVPGDNLFRDFQVDFSGPALEQLSAADRHVLENVRDVVLLGKEDLTCLSCHDVHRQSSKKHRRLDERDFCFSCHSPGKPRKVPPPEDEHNRTCAY